MFGLVFTEPHIFLEVDECQNSLFEAVRNYRLHRKILLNAQDLVDMRLKWCQGNVKLKKKKCCALYISDSSELCQMQLRYCCYGLELGISPLETKAVTVR